MTFYLKIGAGGNSQWLVLLEEAIEIANNYEKYEVFVIGGGQVYREVLEKNMIDVMYLTHVHAEPEGDTFFPKINETEWNVEIVSRGEQNEKNDFSYTIKKYTRR